jgi:hypothetical protein
MAALWLLVITGGLVWGGMELFKRFEIRHAKAPGPVLGTAAKPETKAPEPAIEITEEEKAVPATEPEPPKRAIIVRDE